MMFQAMILKRKKEQLEEMKAYNFFSSLGKKIAQFGLASTTEKTIDSLTDLMKEYV